MPFNRGRSLDKAVDTPAAGKELSPALFDQGVVVAQGGRCATEEGGWGYAAQIQHQAVVGSKRIGAVVPKGRRCVSLPSKHQSTVNSVVSI